MRLQNPAFPVASELKYADRFIDLLLLCWWWCLPNGPMHQQLFPRKNVTESSIASFFLLFCLTLLSSQNGQVVSHESPTYLLNVHFLFSPRKRINVVFLVFCTGWYLICVPHTRLKHPEI